ncbi:unnamed protein product [Adineta steineri]|uniref:G-protein coupled receptors family 1 profile domain-containing protein n=1 Tax=Adineta steineri TaxID=433720 RepID=A0A814TS39_9BILA|nr:unnamed protein product [Adineta steineri]
MSVITTLTLIQYYLTNILGGLLVIGVFGNILNCLVFLRKRLRSNPCSILFAAASLANIIVMIYFIIPTINSLYNTPLENSNLIYCKLRLYIRNALRDNSPPASSSSYRHNYISRNNGNDLYIHDEYRSPTPPSNRNTTDAYNDIYQTNDYNNRSERYDIAQNRCSSSRDYTMTSVPSPSYRSDPYRTSSNIPSSSSPSSSSAAAISSSLYIPRDQYIQSLPSVREIDCRSRTYGMSTSMDHGQIITNKSSDHYYDNHRSYRERSNLKRLRSNFHNIETKRLMRR